MRSHLLALVSLLLVSMSGYTDTMGSPARAQALLWATQAGGTSIDEGLGIATTERGDSYVTGFFNQGTATFGKGEPNETTLTSAGGSAIFVAKYDRDGALLWATPAGGAGSDLGRGIASHRARRQLRDRAFLGHGDLRQGRAQRDHPHHGGEPRYLRCQVRPRRRAALGHPGRRHPAVTKASASRPPRAATAT